MIAPSRSGRAGRWSSPLSCQLRTKVEHGAGCFHEKSHCFSEKGQRGGVERKISQVGKTAVKSEPPALRCKLILFSLRAGRRPASSGGTPPPPPPPPPERPGLAPDTPLPAGEICGTRSPVPCRGSDHPVWLAALGSGLGCWEEGV